MREFFMIIVVAAVGSFCFCIRGKESRVESFRTESKAFQCHVKVSNVTYVTPKSERAIYYVSFGCAAAASF